MEQQRTVCTNPATGHVVGYSDIDSVRQVAAAVDASRAAQATWQATPVQERARAILRIRDYVAQNAEEIAQIISANNGKTRVDAISTEVLPAIMAADYYIKHAAKFLQDRALTPSSPLLANKISKILRVPYGVIGIISPWNYPFAIPFSEVIMGLLAGNGVLLKVATNTQLVGRELERAVEAAGLPAGLFAHLNVPGALAGEAFLKAGIDKLFFTGSVAVGKTLMKQAAETLTPVSLELGGNDAMLVCPRADIDRAAAGATWAAFQNAGQSCGGVERIYVHRDVYQPFMDNLRGRVQALRVGYDADFNVDIGALTTESQLKLVREHVRDALDKGATLYAESACPTDTKGLFFPATVLADVTHEMLVMRNETFGPVVGVMKVDSMEEAVELANDSDLGLTASVWSEDRKEAEHWAKMIRVGTVMINDHLMSHGLPETPWGGFKQSGIGRTHGKIGFDEMTQPQCIVQDYMPVAKKNMWWHPHSKSVYDGILGIIKMMHAAKPVEKVAGLGRLAKLFPRTFSADK